MKSVGDLLRDGDPVAGDHELGDEFGEDAVRRMRQVVLADRTGERDGTGLVWRGLAVLASIVVAALALGTWLADARVASGPDRLARIDRAPAPEPPAAIPGAPTPHPTSITSRPETLAARSPATRSARVAPNRHSPSQYGKRRSPHGRSMPTPAPTA